MADPTRGRPEALVHATPGGACVMYQCKPIGMGTCMQMMRACGIWIPSLPAYSRIMLRHTSHHVTDSVVPPLLLLFSVPCSSGASVPCFLMGQELCLQAGEIQCGAELHQVVHGSRWCLQTPFVKIVSERWMHMCYKTDTGQKENNCGMHKLTSTTHSAGSTDFSCRHVTHNLTHTHTHPPPATVHKHHQAPCPSSQCVWMAIHKCMDGMYMDAWHRTMPAWLAGSQNRTTAHATAAS